MSLTKEDLDNLSQLARIVVKEEEKEKMLHDMQAILGYVSDLDADGGGLAAEVRGKMRETVFNVVREDAVTREPGSNTDDLLREAPETEDGYVKVAQVLK